MVNYNYGFLYNTPKVRRIGGHGFYLRNGLEAKGRTARAAIPARTTASRPRAALIDNIVSGPISVEGFGSGVARLSGLRNAVLQHAS